MAGSARWRTSKRRATALPSSNRRRPSRTVPRCSPASTKPSASSVASSRYTELRGSPVAAASSAALSSPPSSSARRSAATFSMSCTPDVVATVSHRVDVTSDE